MKASSAVRDCDVAEKLLVRLEADPRILGRLATRRAKRALRLAEVLKEVAAGGLEAVKLPVAPRSQPTNGARAAISDEDLLPRKARQVLSAAFKDFLKRGDRAYRERDSGRLHKFRIHAKELRYMLELFVGSGTGFDCWVEPVRQVQSLLGDAHDCEAVREMIAGWPGRKPVSARLKRRRDSKQRQFRRLWRERFARATIPHPRATPTPPGSPRPR
jgi:CHAD domain-containing protein